MYLNIGGEELLKKDIIGIFDLDTATVSKRTRDSLRLLQEEKKVVTLTYDLPKAFIIENGKGKDQTVYISQFSVNTLMGRANDLY